MPPTPAFTAGSLRTRPFPIAGRWCVHGYYSLCPYAPDRSGRFLLAAADLDTRMGEVLVMTAEGSVAERFGAQPLTPSFWHTGLWQSWSPDARHVYFQSGSHSHPRVTRHELATGEQVHVDADLEGTSPLGEPGVAALHGMLYAAGYGGGGYQPERAPVPFQDRERHGLSLVSFDPPASRLRLSVQEILDRHPDRDRLLEADRAMKRRLGSHEGLTLIAYCVRWSPDGNRLLFHFGNHEVAQERGEPRLSYVFTASPDLEDLRLALDLSWDRRGVHWSWQPDGRRLIGYISDPAAPQQHCLAEVDSDGAGFRKLSDHGSGGHPSVSPADEDLIMTDEVGPSGLGAVVFLSRRTGGEVARVPLPQARAGADRRGRHPQRVCHHPVFSQEGSRVLCNALPGRYAEVREITPP